MRKDEKKEKEKLANRRRERARVIETRRVERESEYGARKYFLRICGESDSL